MEDLELGGKPTKKAPKTSFDLLVGDETDFTPKMFEDLKDRFFESIGQNGRKVFEIRKQGVHDRTNKIKSASHVLYTLEKLKVEETKFDLIGNKPFVIINGTVNISLFPTTFAGSEDSWTYYDEETAVNKWEKLMKTSIDKVTKDREDAQLAVDDLVAAEEFLLDVLSKKLF